jgi:hypothetical protein
VVGLAALRARARDPPVTALLRIACAVVGCRLVPMPFAARRRWTRAGVSGSCVTPELRRCARCGQVRLAG